MNHLSLTYIIRWEELINDFICQFVDIFIFVILQLLHLFQTCGTQTRNCTTFNNRHINSWWWEVKIKPWWYKWSSPPHSSMRLAIVSASSSAILRILLRPSRTTCTTWASLTVSRLQNGGITCFSMRCATCRQQRHNNILYISNLTCTRRKKVYSFVGVIFLAVFKTLFCH